MCVGIIRNNSLVGGRARAESNPGHWARHALLHMAAESIEGYFGTEFPAICNYCGVTAAWRRKTLIFKKKFVHFSKNEPLR